MNHLISVIMPTYNCGRYIQSSVESVLSQSFQDFELIIIDDGSTDHTEDVIRAINDPRIRYFRTPNQGNYFARNRGLKEARGGLIAFLDSDDVMLPERLAKQREKFMQNPELGLCCANFYVQLAGQEGKLFQDTSYSFPDDLDTSGGMIELALENNFMLTSTVMIRRECVERLGYFDTTFQNAMDYEYCLRIMFHYSAYYMGDRLTKRLEHDSNISKNKANTYKALLYIFGEHAEVFKGGKYYQSKHAKLITHKFQKSMYYLGLESLSSRQYDEACRYLTQCGYSEKVLFKYLAICAARLRSRWLVSWILLYRRKKQREHMIALVQ